MKIGVFGIATGLLVSLLTVGCGSTRQVRHASGLGVVDAVPGTANPGYVEFMSVSKNVPIPIYQLDSQGRPYPLAAVGLKQGDRYSLARHEVPVLENLRVVEPAGTHTFVIERYGDQVQIPVQSGQITPVEIDYELIEQGEVFRTYRVDLRVFDPVPHQNEKLSSLIPKR